MGRFPTDWPAAGEIDLAVHDLPHRSAATEWWYVNCHLETRDARKLSLFAAFFRTRDRDGWAHSVTWALSDAAGRAYHADSRVDANAPRLGLERIRAGRGSKDPRLNRAISEMLERGRIPSPDRMFEGPVHVSSSRLELDFGGLRFEKLENGNYRLQLHDARSQAGCDLEFAPEKAPQRHGDDGLVHGPSGEEMFYYFIPRCRVTGTVIADGLPNKVASGSAWYDHEFGGPTELNNTPAVAVHTEVAWNWLAAQLGDGSEVTAYSLVRCSDGKVLDQRAVLIDAAGERTQYSELTLLPSRPWRSVRTFYDYPTRWLLSVPAAGMSLSLSASFEDQEFMTVISKPAFWEGRCEVRGTLRGDEISGLAYVERSGFAPIEDLDDFFAAVGEEVRKSVAAVLPLEPTRAHAQSLIAADGREQYLDGVHLPQLSQSLFRPIREVTDRGGKSWRSYAALACCDVVQGDSRKFVQWLAMPELLHVGSLIVDDVQDKSAVRRGGPACHVVHGEPLAINAGTAAYFLTQRLLMTNDISPARKLRLYDLYFEAMCAGHAGQALDLDGLAELMPDAVATGNSYDLERRILATHRLKAAAPAASLARMGAVAGGGTEVQIEAVGRFFESLGLAFQIVDDVLNLRGFKGDLKARAEDISNGTVTLPVAKAMGLVSAEQRAWLWSTLQAKTKDAKVLAEAVELLESCGALSACADEAKSLVESAWQRADPVLSDSIPKVMMRAFGWYVLERHY